jgi:polysaccharide biosynthesis transport protein
MQEKESLDLDFGKYLLALKRHWIPMVGVFVTTVTLSAFSTTLLKPSYRAEGKLLFKEDRSAVLTGLGTDAAQLKPIVSTQNPLNTQIEVITSATVLEKTIASLQLKDDKGKLLTPKDFKQKLEVKIIGGTDVLHVTYTSPDAKQSANVVNKLMQFYREVDILNKRDEAKSAREFIAKQLPIAEKSLSETELALRNFKEQNRIVDLATESESAVTKIRDIETEITGVKARLDGAQAQSNTWRKELGINFEQAIATNILSKSPAVQAIVVEIEAVERELANQRSRFQESHPAIVTLKDKQNQLRSNLNARIREAIGRDARIPDGLLQANQSSQTQDAISDYIQIETERINLAQQLLSLYSSMSNVQKRANTLPRLEQTQRLLERKLETSQTEYRNLFTKIQEAQLASQKDSTNVSIIEAAIVPKEAELTKTIQVIALGVIFGAFLATTTVLLLERKDRSLKTIKEIKQRFSYPLLGIIPSLEKSRKVTSREEDLESLPTVIVQNAPDSPVSESYRMLQSNLKFLSSDKKLKVIVVTSAISKEGKSTVAANLAAAMAQAGRKVLLVDADLHHPQQHRIWEIYPNVGLSNLLVEQTDRFKTLQSSGIANLDILTSGVIPPSPATLLDSQRMATLLKEFSSRYDFVIIDTPSVNIAADAPILNRMADGMLLVVKPGVIDRASADFAKEILQQSGQNILGIAINGVIPENEPYSYYYFGSDKQEPTPTPNIHPEVKEAQSAPDIPLTWHGNKSSDGAVGLETLKSITVQELETVIGKLQRDWQQMLSLVNEQEDELAIQGQTVKELQKKLNKAGQRQRLQLEQELAYEQERQRMLNATLVGQRQTLSKKQEILRRHQDILQRKRSN